MALWAELVRTDFLLRDIVVADAITSTLNSTTSVPTVAKPIVVPSNPDTVLVASAQSQKIHSNDANAASAGQDQTNSGTNATPAPQQTENAPYNALSKINAPTIRGTTVNIQS